jgi:low temperature requirement protein LtrA
MEERHASWLELFFDLVFVVAIAELRWSSCAWFGVFAGLSVVAVTLGEAHNHWHAASAVTAAIGFAAVACLGWVYFGHGIPGGLSSTTGSMQLYPASTSCCSAP